MVKDRITKRQQQVFDYIRDRITNRGYGPTVREIGAEFEIRSPNGVVCHLRALERKGLIRRHANKSRAIELIDRDGRTSRRSKSLPLAGIVAAGVATLAEEQRDKLDFGRLFGAPNLYALQVSGDSMIEAHIDDGDYVIVRKAVTATPGDMVVALIDDEATLKYWHPEPEQQRIRLQPANAAMSPIYVSNAKVIGVVVGVVRKMA